MSDFIDPLGVGQRVAENVYTTTFRKPDLKSERGGFPYRECGYKPDGKPVPEAYLAKVTSIRNAATIISPLQDEISLRVESHWAPFIPTALIGIANRVMQLASGGRVSAITKATSRRMWTGSTPVTLSLKMNFQAVSDPIIEVVEPMRILGTIALPAENNIVSNDTAFGGVINKLPFLGPPGPSPYKLEGVIKKPAQSQGTQEIISAIDSLQGGDKITVELGQFLTFFNVIVKEVSQTVPIKFDIQGNPVSAQVNVVFETYEMMTAESYRDAFRNKSVSTQ